MIQNDNTDKHGFQKRRKLKFSLILRLLLTLFVCGYALHRCSLRACAEVETVTLSPEQTYALFMRDFSVTYHDTSSNIDYPLQMELYGTSAEVAPPENLFVSGGIIDSTSSTIVPLWKQHNYIIVRFSWPSGSTFVSPYANNDYITIVNNLNVAGLNYYSGRILVTVGNAFRPSNTTSWNLVQRTEYRLDTSNGVITHQNAISGAGRPVRILTGLTQSGGSIPQDEMLYLTGDTSISWFDSADTYSISSLTTVWKSPVQWGYSDTSGHVTINHLHSYFCYIECPTLSSGYIPPATTPQTTVITTKPDIPADTAASKPVAGTVDLSNLESGVAALVSQNVDIYNDLEWIGGNVMIAANNLYAISQQLERIYQKMWDNGEIPLDAGLNPPNYENLQNFAQSALATRGTNSPAESTWNMQSGFAAFFTLGNTFARAPLFAPFLLVAGVGLAMGVLAFVLFRKV